MRKFWPFLAIFAVSVLIFGLSRPASAEIYNFVFLHTGDTEGHLLPFTLDDPAYAQLGTTGKPVGGIPKRHMFITTKRQAKKLNWVLLDSGGALGGTPLSNLYQGFVDIEMMNRLKYDAMALGLREFGFGQEVLKDRMAQAEFPMLCANAKRADSGELVGKAYAIIERGGLRLGVFGLISGQAADRINPNLIEGISFDDPIATAKSLIAELSAKCDVIIALTHQGIAADIQLAVECPDIDIVVGGMDGTELEVPMLVGDTLIVHAGKWGKKVGMLKCTFEGEKESGYKIRYFDETLIPMDGKWVDNTDILKILRDYEKKLDSKLGVVICELDKDYSDLKIRATETELGNLCAEIAREFAGTDIAFLSAASVRASLPGGPVTVGDVYSAFPFDHVLVSFELTGAEIQRLLDQGASKIGRPGFPLVSGLSFGIFGGRAYEAAVRGVNLLPDSSYTVVTTDYIASGGDGYGVFQDKKPLVYTGVSLRDAVEAYLRQHSNASFAADGRIYFLTEQPETTEVYIPEETDTEPEAAEPIEAAPEVPLEGEIVNLEDVAPEGSSGQPVMVEEIYLGVAELTEDNLHYAFAVLPRESGGAQLYEFRLTVTNVGDINKLINFKTFQRVDFRVKEENRLVWNWAARRYWKNEVDSLTLLPGESLYFNAFWDGSENSGVQAGKKLYKFEGEFLYTQGKTLGFTSLLEWHPQAIGAAPALTTAPSAAAEEQPEAGAPSEEASPPEGESGSEEADGGEEGESGDGGSEESGSGGSGWF